MKTLTRALAPAADASEGPACKGMDIFFPKSWQVTPVTAPPSAAEQAALQVCARCPVREWCLAQDLRECTSVSQVLGVRGGLRQLERRALYIERYGRRPRNGAQK